MPQALIAVDNGALLVPIEAVSVWVSALVFNANGNALLVREDYAQNPSDEPPVAGARLIRLPTLGKSGLSNAGERLALVDGAGLERSVLPALAGKAGQSLARLTPTSEDSDPKSFSFGTPTPGFANDALPGAP